MGLSSAICSVADGVIRIGLGLVGVMLLSASLMVSEFSFVVSAVIVTIIVFRWLVLVKVVLPVMALVV